MISDKKGYPSPTKTTTVIEFNDSNDDDENGEGDRIILIVCERSFQFLSYQKWK